MSTPALPPADHPFLARVLRPAAGAGALHVLWQTRVLDLHPAPAFAVQWAAVNAAEGALLRVVLNSAGLVVELQNAAGWQPDKLRPDGDALRWRRPTQTPSRMALLAFRHRVLRAMRGWFDAQGFLELDTPSLARAPSPEAQFDPIPAGPGWLITSPEFQLKRLLVGGFERIARIGPAYRGAEQGRHHNPEFTLLEWYRVHPQPDGSLLAADLAALLRHLAPLAREFAAREAAPEQRGDLETGDLEALAQELEAGPLPRQSVADLVRQATGVDLRGVVTLAALRQALARAGAPEADAEGDFTALFSALWLRVEAQLPPTPLLVCDWPAPLASLARLKPTDPTVAERLELYIRGVELANGFVELTDAAEQRRRFAADQAARAAQGLPTVPLDERFLAALEEGLPPCVGMALGVDRLVMLLCGATEIGAVLPFCWDEV